MLPRRFVLRRPLLAPNPGLFSGTVPLALAVLVAALQSCAAQGQTPAPKHPTPEWLADNPSALADATRACRSDPGRLARSALCVNAAAARAIVAQRETDRAIAQARRSLLPRRAPGDPPLPIYPVPDPSWTQWRSAPPGRRT